MELGATDYVDGSKEDTAEALQKMGGADLVVVTAPNPKIIGPLVGACGPMGKVLVLARKFVWHYGWLMMLIHTIAVGDITVSTIPMIMKGISVHGWPSGHSQDSEEAIRFAQHQGVKCMVEKFPLEKAQEAMDHMLSGKVRFRAVLTME